MSQEPSYTIIQRDHYGDAVNTVTGLNEAAANSMALMLRTGSAYTGERPWTCDIERELTPAEQAQEAARRWRQGATEATRLNRLDRVSHIAQTLRGLAADLDQLGEMEIPGTAVLAVRIQVFGQGMPQVYAIAGAFGQTAFRETLPDGSAGGYITGHGDLQVITTAREPEPTPAAEPEAPVAAEPAQDVDAVEHYHQSASTGGPGECSASCACGTIFDGFDTVSEAIEQLNQHIANPDAAEHRHVGGAAGGPGENEAECSCGTVFAGFDTHAEAVAALDKHITARRNGTPEPVGT